MKTNFFYFGLVQDQAVGSPPFYDWISVQSNSKDCQDIIAVIPEKGGLYPMDCDFSELNGTGAILFVDPVDQQIKLKEVIQEDRNYLDLGLYKQLCIFEVGIFTAILVFVTIKKGIKILFGK